MCTLTASFAIAAYASGIINTKHNLSLSGKGIPNKMVKSFRLSSDDNKISDVLVILISLTIVS